MSQQRFFTDRADAGRLLAAQLAPYHSQADVLVLALPRGGVPVAYEVARALQAPLDVLLVRKLGVPGSEEYAMGAVANGGLRVVRKDVCQMLNIPQEAVDAAAERELEVIRRRERLYHDVSPHLPYRDRTVILVDDGLATGATMLAAVRLLRQAMPRRIIGAVPVGSLEACQYVGAEMDELVCLYTPEPFHAVGLWYGSFDQTSDEDVMRLLAQANGIDAAAQDAIHQKTDNNKGAYRETGSRT